MNSLEMRILLRTTTTNFIASGNPVTTPRCKVLLTMTELTQEIQELINGPRNFRFKMLPFVALESGYSCVSNPTTEMRVTLIAKTSYALA